MAYSWVSDPLPGCRVPRKAQSSRCIAVLQPFCTARNQRRARDRVNLCAFKSRRWSKSDAASSGCAPTDDDQSCLTRRAALAALSMVTTALAPCGVPVAQAIQGSTAGRIPGISVNPDAEGFYLYTRPEGKSGGHGVGWSEIPRYSFKVPEGWEETPVSIADLGGTEIDLRFSSKEQGSLQVVVAPVLRFADVGFNADVRIETIGTPAQIISGFAPELFGKPLSADEGDVVDTVVYTKNNLKYYRWETKDHHLVAATAVGNRLFILATTCNSRQWKKFQSNVRAIQESFTVPSSA